MQVQVQKREDTQTTIIALLVPYKTGCSLSKLCEDYYNECGESIPWRELGYFSLMSFLESMSKSVQIEYRNGAIFLKGITSNKSKHISKLVGGQKDQKPVLSRRTYRPSAYYPKTAPPKLCIPAEVLTIIIDIVNEHEDGVSKDFVLRKVQICMPYSNITMSEMEEQLHVLSHKIYFSGNKIFPVKSKPQSLNSKQVSVTVAGEEDLDEFDDCAGEDDFEFISPRRVPPVLPTRLPAKVKSTSNFIKESVNATQSKCKTTTANNRFNENSDSGNYNNVEKENDVENNYTEDLINSRIRFRLEKLIQNSPNGIWCADLPEKYLEEYKVPLNYTELGFSSVREFASQLPNIFHCVQIDDTGDFILYHSKGQIPSINSKGKQKIVNLAEMHQIYLTDEEDEALPTTLTLSTCNQLIPEGIVTIGESVGHLNAMDLVSKEKPYIEVVVVEVFTPTFFWIQLRKKQKAFKTFMDDLHNFYVTKHQDYAIPPVILERGLNCACIYNNIWHRGIIKTVNPDLQVTVMFYDYGTLKTYQPNEVYYLHRMFSVLPAQAIPCGLYNVRPYKTTKWTRKATHQFAVRTSSIPLVATVESQWINETDNSMLITLTDTLEEEDVHINDWLVEKKLAEHGKMGDKVDMHNLLLYVEENLLFSPEQCYQTESNSSHAVDNVNEETSGNGPLISPQSTLEDHNLKFFPQQELHEKSDRSQNLQDQSHVQNNSLPRVTQPFAQPDEPICNQDKSQIAAENLFQLWNENLKLQIQISSIFEMLFNKAMNISETGDSSTKNKNTLNTMDTVSHLNTNGNSVAANLQNINAANTYPFTLNSIQNVGNLSRDMLNDNLNVKKCTNFLQQSLKQLNTLYSGINIVEDSNLDRPSQLFPNKSAMSRIPPGFENVTPKVNLDNPNLEYTKAVNTDLPEAFEKPASFNIPLKETNPFKSDIINKLQASQEQISSNNSDLFASNKNQEPVVKRNTAIFKEENTAIVNPNFDVSKQFSTRSPLGYPRYYSSCQLNTTDNTDTTSKYVSTDYPRPNVTNDTGIVSNSLSTMLRVNDLHGATNHLEAERENRVYSENYDAYKYTPSYLRMRSQEHEQKHEEDVALKHSPSTTAPWIDFAPSHENKSTVTSWLLSDRFPSPVAAMQDSKNVDEGYLTRPSTSHTLDRLSPLTQTIADAEQYSASAKIWSTSAVDKSTQSETCGQMYPQYLQNGNTETTCNQRQLQDNSKCHSVPTKKMYIKLIELPKRQVHIIHYQDEGWLLIEEFTSFTNLLTVSQIFDVTRKLDFSTPFAVVDREQCSIECLESNSSWGQQTKDIIDGFNTLCLIRLKSTLKLLKKLNMICAQELNDLLTQNKFENGSIMHEIWVNIIDTCGVRLQRSNILTDDSTYILI